jgi:hypothetical protein
VLSAIWAVVVTLVAVAPMGAQDQGPTRSGARVTAEVAVGTLLTPVGFFGTGWAAKRLAQRAEWPDERARRVAYVAAYVGATAAAAAGPALVGNGGNFPVAFAGGAAGVGAAALTARLGRARYDGDRGCGILCWGLGALTIALPSIGATFAYEASRK